MSASFTTLTLTEAPSSANHAARKTDVESSRPQFYANAAAFPGTGVAERVYVAIDTGYQYQWKASAYVLMAGGDGGTDATKLPLAGGTMGSGAAIGWLNGSLIRAGGTDDQGVGGNGGIEQVCSVGFADRFEAGRHTVFNESNVVQLVYGTAATPTSSHDASKRFAAGVSLWIVDDGRRYLCTDDTPEAAVWERQSAAIPVGDITDLGSGVADALAVAPNVAGGFATDDKAQKTISGRMTGTQQAFVAGTPVTYARPLNVRIRYADSVPDPLQFRYFVNFPDNENSSPAIIVSLVTPAGAVADFYFYISATDPGSLAPHHYWIDLNTVSAVEDIAEAISNIITAWSNGLGVPVNYTVTPSSGPTGTEGEEEAYKYITITSDGAGATAWVSAAVNSEGLTITATGGYGQTRCTTGVPVYVSVLAMPSSATGSEDVSLSGWISWVFWLDENDGFGGAVNSTSAPLDAIWIDCTGLDDAAIAAALALAMQAAYEADVAYAISQYPQYSFPHSGDTVVLTAGGIEDGRGEFSGSDVLGDGNFVYVNGITADDSVGTNAVAEVPQIGGFAEILTGVAGRKIKTQQLWLRTNDTTTNLMVELRLKTVGGDFNAVTGVVDTSTANQMVNVAPLWDAADGDGKSQFLNGNEAGESLWLRVNDPTLYTDDPPVQFVDFTWIGTQQP